MPALRHGSRYAQVMAPIHPDTIPSRWPTCRRVQATAGWVAVAWSAASTTVMVVNGYWAAAAMGALFMLVAALALVAALNETASSH